MLFLISQTRDHGERLFEIKRSVLSIHYDTIQDTEMLFTLTAQYFVRPCML